MRLEESQKIGKLLPSEILIEAVRHERHRRGFHGDNVFSRDAGTVARSGDDDQCVASALSAHAGVYLPRCFDAVDLMAGHELSVDQEDYLDLLSDLMAKYEEETSPMGKGAAPREVLAWLMEEHGMGVTELGKLLGDRSLGSRIVSGERSLSKSHIRILAEHFKVSPAAFI